MITVPIEVFRQFLKVRDSGRCNMFNVTCVQRAAYDMDLHALVSWIEDSSGGDVGRIVMGNVMIEDEDGREWSVDEFEKGRV